MSGYYVYPDEEQAEENQEYASPFQGTFQQPTTGDHRPPYSTYSSPQPLFAEPHLPHSQPQSAPLYTQPQAFVPSQPQYGVPVTSSSQQPWSTFAFPPDYSYQQPYRPPHTESQQTEPFPVTSWEPGPFPYTPPLAGPSTGNLFPPHELIRPRPARASSTASFASSSVSYVSDASRSGSPSAAEMARWGRRNADGSWSCAFHGCTSHTTFTRGCDLRKHYKRHTKSLFCRYEGCPQAKSGGFSSKKDLVRHEAKHNPNIPCEWQNCDRLFSRVDNMKDHVRRVHLKKKPTE